MAARTKRTPAKVITAEIKAEEVEEIKAEQPYRVVRSFFDRYANKNYQVNDIYVETSPERTKALSEAVKSELNTIGDIFIKQGE